MDSACVATVRAATCMQKGVSSPAILKRSGSIRSSPWDAVKVVVSAPGGQRAVDRAGRAALGLHLHHVRHARPRGSASRSAAHSSACSPMGDAGVIG